MVKSEMALCVAVMGLFAGSRQSARPLDLPLQMSDWRKVKKR